MLFPKSQCGAQARFFERNADGFNAMFLRQAQGNFEQSRQHVYVFMPVEVRWADAGVAQFLNLRVSLLFDFVEAQTAACGLRQQTFGSVGKLPFVVLESSDAFVVR